MPEPNPIPAALRRPPLAAAALFLACLALYAATAQGVLYGDGVFYLTLARDTLEGAARPVGHHPLYLPVLAGAAWLGGLAGLGLEASGALLSALAMAGAMALLYLVLLEWLAGAAGWALFGALLAALSPAAWFFATTTENHALHLLAVALLLLALTRAARLPGPGPALLAGLLAVPAYLSHTTALLLLPFLLAAFAVFRAESGLPPPWTGGWRRALLAAACLLGPIAVMRICMPWLYTWLNAGTDPFHGQDPSAATFASLLPRAGLEPDRLSRPWELPWPLIRYTVLNAGAMLAYLRDDWLAHSGLAGGFFLAGFLALLLRWRRGLSPWLFLGLLAFLPYAWLFAFWAVRPVEKGAYFLPILPATVGAGLVGLLALPAPPRRLGRFLPAAGLGLLLLQGYWARRTVADHAAWETRREWAAAASSLVSRPGAPEGLVLTGDGHRLFFLRLYHRNEAMGFLLEELLPMGGGPLAARIRQELDQGRQVYLDELFAAKAREDHPELWRGLAGLPWREAAAGLARGLLLAPQVTGGR